MVLILVYLRQSDKLFGEFMSIRYAFVFSLILVILIPYIMILTKLLCFISSPWTQSLKILLITTLLGNNRTKHPKQNNSITACSKIQCNRDSIQVSFGPVRCKTKAADST